MGLRNQLMSLVTSLSLVQSRAARALSMTEVAYRGSPIVRQDRSPVWEANVLASTETEAPGLADWAAFGEGPSPGDRAPDAPLVPGAPGHTLLLFDGAAATAAGYANLTAIAETVRGRFGQLVDVHVVVPYASAPAALRWDGSVICDGESEVHVRYGARSECLYLVRPDGYVAYRCQPADGKHLGAYLQSIFTASAMNASTFSTEKPNCSDPGRTASDGSESFAVVLRRLRPHL